MKGLGRSRQRQGSVRIIAFQIGKELRAVLSSGSEAFADHHKV